MAKGFLLAASLLAALVAGCASPATDTAAMGAGPACDLRVDVGAGHRCALTHVTPPDAQSQLTWDMEQFERQTAPRH